MAPETVEITLTTEQMARLTALYKKISKVSTDAEAQKVVADSATAEILSGLPPVSAHFAALVAREVGGAQ
ncbi:hypothetical protein [Tunturibacter empetritectus]|uniref:Uncharacterized protein n=1 Tax=Tunturiibacter empetritectus TaxID=3069691 RepID=A0A7W8MRZ9_9BACT|nr:hypothetical protein [Edaphobacter lichenicola]MBB5316679.1 hypothetical protein [Edaphobacter lichenicola]